MQTEYSALFQKNLNMMTESISVKQLNFYVKSLIDGDVRLNNVSVNGELSNFKNHYSSGHWYFTLKDKDASVSCVMFRSAVGRVDFNPENGMKVTVTGRVSIYEADGKYQFYADYMTPFGIGDLAQQFKLVKEKLQKEGLFEESTKRPLPLFPKRVAVVTSDTGAAIKDICSTLKTRLPTCEIIVCPVAVQGLTAASEMIRTLDRIYSLSDIDAVIIGRGGGSAEDLAAFNDEMLARKIYESPVPVISAVGHETDFSISDFVADVRAATPTAAAMVLGIDINKQKQKISDLKYRIIKLFENIYEKNAADYKLIASSDVLKNPAELIKRKNENLNYLIKMLSICEKKIFEASENRFKNTVGLLDSLSPLKTLNRGFSVVTDNKKVICSVNDIESGQRVTLRFFDGFASAEIKEKSDGKI